MYTEKKMRKALLWLASLMVLVVVSTAQAPPPLPPGVMQEVEACLEGGVGACEPFADSTTTRPTAICCDPLESLIQNNVSCLCLFFGNDEVIQALELDVAKAITLPQRCGLQPFDLSANCPGVDAPPNAPSTVSANAPTSVSMAPSQAPTPAPSSLSIANGPTSGGDSSGTSNIAWSGSAILGSFLICATLMFY